MARLKRWWHQQRVFETASKEPIRRTTFFFAKLAGADLRSATLNGQNLRTMDLQGVDFSMSDMIEADCIFDK